MSIFFLIIEIFIWFVFIRIRTSRIYIYICIYDYACVDDKHAELQRKRRRRKKNEKRKKIWILVLFWEKKKKMCNKQKWNIHRRRVLVLLNFLHFVFFSSQIAETLKKRRESDEIRFLNIFVSWFNLNLNLIQLQHHFVVVLFVYRMGHAFPQHVSFAILFV